MADTKVSALSPVTPILTDELYIVDDPGGTPASGRVTLTAINTLLGNSISIGASQIASLTATVTELNYTDGVTSNIQTQLGTKVTSGGALGTPTSGTLTSCTGLPISGLGTSTSSPIGVGSVELGHASDTTLSRDAAGKLAVEGVRVADDLVTENAQTGTSYTLVLTDRSKLVSMSNASANELTIPTNASVAFPVGTTIVVQQKGAGATTITGDTGVTVNGVSAGSGDLSAQWGAVSLYKSATNTWYAMGAIGTVA